MIKYFEDNVVLTSQNPEAFLVMEFEGADTPGYVDPSINLSAIDLYVNGWDTETISAADGSAAVLYESGVNAVFHLFTDSVEDFDYNLTFITPDGNIDVSIYNRPFLLDENEFNAFENFSPLVDNEASYLLLRTNPKYSGNVKLMVDVSENMFLDTFKVSDILSNKKYRRQAVSGNSFLSGDIRRVFSSLPSGEIFRVAAIDTLNISNPKTDYFDQYNTRYNYGARILIDELYSEEYSILAPLWINNKLPDHFAVFRLDGNFNQETYDGDSLNELAHKYITNGELIESWNMKSNVPLGTYLNNHLSELLKVESPVTLSLNEYDPNTWNGMTVDKGIIAGRSEVPYFFNKTAHNFTDLNAFVSQGFERNNLLCPNLLNIEFAFNDSDVSAYTMQRYFGLYLSENELYEFSYYSDEPDSSINIISLDGKDVLNFADSSVFDSSTGVVNETYENRLFVLNDGVELERITSISQFNDTNEYIEEYVNKLGKNIFNTPIIKKDINTFISLKINNILKQGEHLRIINKTQNIIWEIYGSETEVLDSGEAGPYVSYNEPSLGYPALYRTSFSVMGNISDQVEAIRKAFMMFSDYEFAPFKVGFAKEAGLSLILNDANDDDEYLFQRLTSQIAYSIGDPASAFNNASAPGDITFFGVLTPDVADFTRIPFDASYGPIDFELYGDRFSLILDMINTDEYNVYSFDSSMEEFFTENVLYNSTDGWNRLIHKWDVSAGVSHKYQWVEDPTTQYENSIIITDYEIDMGQDNIWWAYDVFPLYVSLMGINPVKDLDFTVYDSSTTSMDFKSDYWNAHEGDELTYQETIDVGEENIFTARGSYIIIQGQGFIDIDGSSMAYNSTLSTPDHFNTFFGAATIRATSGTIVMPNVLDGSHNYTSYEDGISEESIYDYYADNYYTDGSNNLIKDKKSLKYGLTIPTVSKWGMAGQDVRDNNVRLNLTGDFFADGSTTTNSNFVPYSDSSLYSDEISYPVFKYSSYDGNDEWKEYVYYDINDVIDGSTKKTVRDLIFDEPYSDIFSKILYNNNNISGNASRSSILYYNLYEDQVITIIKGLKLGLKVTSTGEKNLNATNWDRFRFSLITSPSRNYKNNYPIEVIINENTETILMIWYQGNDVLSYSKRWSSFLPGKGVLIDQWSSNVDKKYQTFYTDPSAGGYSFIKTPFIVDTNRSNTIMYNMYNVLANYDSSTCTPFSQFSYHSINQVNSIFNAYTTTLENNKVDSNLFIFNGKSFDTFDQREVDYVYFPSSISHGYNIGNIASTYLNNYNFYKENTCNFETFKYFVENNNISYQVIQEDSLITSEQFVNQPIEINLFTPIEYKAPGADSSIYTYNGSYTPIFKDILVFEDNENSDLINTVEKDFVFSNTNLQSYKNIYQFWFNKVVDTVTDGDSSNNILYKEDYNPFKSQWDADYYTLSDGSLNTLVNGYESSLELPAFFGSKLISLPEELTLELWNASNSQTDTGVDYYELQFNLTKSIIDLFTNNSIFINNWSSLLTVSEEDINRYIIKTILNYYNISIDKIKPTVYDKEYDGQLLHTIYDSSFENELVNIDSQLSLINNEYIYKLKFDKTNNRSYYTKFTFNKK